MSLQLTVQIEFNPKCNFNGLESVMKLVYSLYVHVYCALRKFWWIYSYLSIERFIFYSFFISFFLQPFSKSFWIRQSSVIDDFFCFSYIVNWIEWIPCDRKRETEENKNKWIRQIEILLNWLNQMNVES